MMRMQKVAVVGIALLLGCVIAPAAYAQDDDDSSPARITIFGSVSFFDADRSFNVEGGAQDDTSTEFLDGGKFGFRGTFDVSEHIAVEGSYSFGRNNLRVRELDEIPIEERSFGIEHQQIYGNVLYFFTTPDTDIRPFVTGGAGVTNYSPTDQAKADAQDILLDGFIDDPFAIGSSSEFGYNFGGGIEAKLHPRIGFRADFLDYVSNVPVFDVPPTKSGTGSEFYPVSGTIQNLVVSVGVVIFF